MDFFNSPFGSFHLQRLPLRNKETLRAWDSADELLVSHLAASVSLTASDSILLINDSFGALACNLHQYNICTWGDSCLAHKATTHNINLNQLDANPGILPSITPPNTVFRLVLIKIPKTLALLEHQLLELKTCIDKDTVVIAAGMVKYLQRSHSQLFEKYLGTTTHSLAVKKARCLFPRIEKLATIESSPYPGSYYQADLQLQLSNHANVFSREKLDIGARFMIEQYAQLPPAHSIIDLGCGNGVLGIMAKRIQAKQHGIDCQVHFVDESYMAISSAETNYSHAFAPVNQPPTLLPAKAFFSVSNCLEDVAFDNMDFENMVTKRAGTEHVELILCNPPFHQNNTVGDFIAEAMFKQSSKVLQQGGQLWVVGNRHLNYHGKLKRLFGNCRTIASNKKFVVLAATVA